VVVFLLEDDLSCLMSVLHERDELLLKVQR
jgi:hypothetical protein